MFCYKIDTAFKLLTNCHILLRRCASDIKEIRESCLNGLMIMLSNRDGKNDWNVLNFKKRRIYSWIFSNFIGF